MLANRYQIGKKLGEGGMGEVHLGLDTLSQQPVAIKRLKNDFVEPELIERFIREGEALRELNHPNIVKLLDAVEHDDMHYLVMEYVTGGNLAELLKTGQLSIEKILRLALDLADALTRAHKLDIIHRDLKPANILIADDGTLRLTDFGVARMGQRERVTATDMIVGTVDYLAPEALDGAGIDTRADIWAFGVMLFEMLAGKRPFTGDSITHTMMAIMMQPVPDLEALCPDAPIALIDLVYRMLEKDRNARIRSVRQVGLELEDILHGRSTQPPPETRFAPPTPDFLHRPKHNLPAQTTSFVGREAELAELAKLVDNPQIRLITILAQGGMGKTRLALESAEQLIPNFEHGAYFVDLAPLSDPAHVVSAIATATSYQFQADDREQKQQILDFLSNKNLLLVMDNYEHLLEGATLVTDILKAASNVKILATSRQRLNQSGETLFNLEGMDFPAWETPADALEYAAVKLFMQSAKRAKPDFEITADNMDAIARICKLVQGLPLGIVLAAAWLPMLSSEEIATEIAQSIDFLESEMSDIPERQRSMRAVFDYSWELMTETEKQVFVKLSVFRGGFSREAAEAVTGTNLRILMSLMNKSLIRRDAQTRRYEIHELLRQYGASRLEESRQAQNIHHTHSVYTLQWLIQQRGELIGRGQPQAVQNIIDDFANIQAAWDFALKINNEALLFGVLPIFTILFQHHEHQVQKINIMSVAIRTFSPASNQENSLWQRVFVRYPAGFPKITGNRERYLETVLQIAESQPDLAEKAFCYRQYGRELAHDNHIESALPAIEKALELFRELEDRYNIAYTLNLLGWVYSFKDIDKSRTCRLEAKVLFDALGEKIVAAENLISLWHIEESPVQREQYIQQARKLASEGSSLFAYIQVHSELAWLAFGRGDWQTFREIAQASVALAEQNEGLSGDVVRTWPYIQLSIVKSVLDKDYEAALNLGKKAHDAAISVFGSSVTHWCMAFALCGLGRFEEASKHIIEFLAFDSQDSWRTVESCLLFTLVFGATGRYERAAVLLGVCHEAQPNVHWLHTWSLAIEIIEKIKRELGEKAYNAAWEQGKSLDLDTVVKELLAEFEQDSN